MFLAYTVNATLGLNLESAYPPLDFKHENKLANALQLLTYGLVATPPSRAGPQLRASDFGDNHLDRAEHIRLTGSGNPLQRLARDLNAAAMLLQSRKATFKAGT
jgi:hypothetical protein